MTRTLMGVLAIALATTTAAFAGELGKTPIDLDGRAIRSQETNLGNFVADAMRSATGADIAVIQAIAFKEDALIPKGTVDEQAMREALTSPTSRVVVLTMKPSVLRKMMDRALSKAPDANIAFLQISGMDVVFDSSKSQTHRIAKIIVDGKPINVMDDKVTYTVAMPRELGLGGAGYLKVFPEEMINDMEITDLSLLDVISKAFDREQGTVNPNIDGRLKDTAKE